MNCLLHKRTNNSYRNDTCVISLFTKVPVDRAIAIAKDRLQTDETLADRTMLTITTDEIIRLLSLCLNATYFTYHNEFYQQVFWDSNGLTRICYSSRFGFGGCGRKSTLTYHSAPIFWKRYVDDICTALKEDLIEEFNEHLNNIEPSIKFTVEKETNGRLAFLDTSIIHHDDGSLTTTVFRKGTHKDKTSTFLSIHTTP